MQLLLPEHARNTYEDLDYDSIATADINLMLAWQVLKDETCPKCGIPSWIGHVSDKWTQFEVRESTCFSCEAIEQYEDEQHEKNKKAKRHGVISYAIPFRVEGAPDPLMPGREAGLKMIMANDEMYYGEPGSEKPEEPQPQQGDDV